MDSAGRSPAPAESSFDRRRRTASLFLGPCLFVLVLLLPAGGLSAAAHRLAAVMAWVLVYWVGEAIPIPATALLGPVLAVLLGIGEPAAVFAPFAHPVVFLFLGSFILAEGMIVHRLNERIALSVLSVKWLLARPWRLSIAVGAIPLLISMWISDSATTAMVYPILLGILATFGEQGDRKRGEAFATGLLLTISYAALIGGTGTPVGTPPNLIGLGMLQKLAGVRILFFEWMLLAVPILLVMAAAMFLVLRIAHPPAPIEPEAIGNYVKERIRERGRWSRGEKNALAAFLVAVVLWIVPGLAASVAGPASDTYRFFERHLPEGVASLTGALLLFILPVDWKSRTFTLRWSEAARIDWGTILLFGGGLSLGGLMFATGLAEWLGNGVVQMSGLESLWGLTAVSLALAILLTEMTSNTATSSMLVPIVIALSASQGVSPVPPVVAVCLGASMAFMLPVSTPSNAIIYASGRVPITGMIRVGFILDLVSFTVILAMLRVMCPLLGLIRPAVAP